ncbi:hypothetical protein LTR95_013034 [Oleoguttula sp. CCFEE 5521]
MPPTLHLLRHAQGYHSTSPEGHSLHDPHLTPHGFAQSATRRDAFPHHDSLELLLASPLRRALQTCQTTFSPAIETRQLKIIALPYAEEASADPCDTGSEIEVLQEEFGHGVDFDHVKHGWTRHEGDFEISPPALAARARKLRAWIRGRDEREIVLVSHGFFNHYITGDVNEKGEQTTGWWREAEWRTFEFVEGDDEGEAGLKETAGSVKRREEEEKAEGGSVEEKERAREKSGGKDKEDGNRKMFQYSPACLRMSLALCDHPRSLDLA